MSVTPGCWSFANPLALPGAQIVVVRLHPEYAADRFLRLLGDRFERLFLLLRRQLGVVPHLLPIIQGDGFVAVSLGRLFPGQLEASDQGAQQVEIVVLAPLILRVTLLTEAPGNLRFHLRSALL